ncbi:hypothetical protein [Alkalihalobacillus pseudalcaliphilus]|uniref:hypothetical protein n=1 Tax=Alkalihalobacillus pseudalcaliphilus TaxID=79884 RepID=UPI00064DF672|nr:hypothetical protein [Alkalihalobacillus pseudalcaliphilus]KMK75453.1 hypothetical protein AB990_09080 [Alkalihalobacillus pseudalcaliphilus]
MAQVKIEVLDAVIDGKRKGEQLTVESKDAAYLIGIGYAKEVVVKATPKRKPKATKKDEE